MTKVKDFLINLLPICNFFFVEVIKNSLQFQLLSSDTKDLSPESGGLNFLKRLMQLGSGGTCIMRTNDGTSFSCFLAYCLY